MRAGHFLAATVTAAAVCLAGAANAAALTYVGSWEVDQGPVWYDAGNGPLAYTGQEAAALLFGGTASQYVISTVDSNPADVNDMAWYSILGSSGGHVFADDYSSKYLGQYYGPSAGYVQNDPNGPASAYVADNATGPDFTNYAFRISAAPEPATWAMLLLGVFGAGAMLRVRGRRQPAAIAG